MLAVGTVEGKASSGRKSLFGGESTGNLWNKALCMEGMRLIFCGPLAYNL